MYFPVVFFLGICLMAAFAQEIPTSQTDGSGSGSIFPDFDDIEGVIPTSDNPITTGTTTESTTEGSSTDSTTLARGSSSTLGPSTSSTTEAATTSVSPTSASTTSSATSPTSTSSSTSSSSPDSTTSDSTSTASAATDSTTTDATSPESTTPSITSTPATSEAPTTSTSTSPADTTPAPTTPASTTPASTTPSSTTPTSTTPASTTPSSTTPASTTEAQTTTIATTTSQPLPEEEQILALLLSNAESIAESTVLVNFISASYSNIDATLDLQALSLNLIEPLENVLQNLTRDVYLTQAEVLDGFLNTLKNIDFIANRTSDNLSSILQIQQNTKNIVKDFEAKVSQTQESIILSSKGLEEKLQLVTRILQDYIKPKVSGLTESIDHLNVSQVNSLAELRNLPLIQNLTGESIIKLSLLNNELSIFYETQENRVNTLSNTLKEWIPTDLDLIEDLLQVLSISQKKTDLAIAVCDNASHKYSCSSKNYEKKYSPDGRSSKDYEEKYNSDEESDGAYYEEVADYDSSSWSVASN
ncbi:cell wall protein DAN4 [Drosophila ananassae]|uniref:cell wall protein DAN4 n=1 Tax=Drosophila ananassae TaxID=7217 RepID=UPI000177B861|nr:cell wall protein DAN4 [Drosophila ananassae]